TATVNRLFRAGESGRVLDVLVNVVVPVVLVAVVGGVAGRRVGLHLETLQRAVFFIFSPALVYSGLRSVDVAPGAIGRLAVISLAVFVANAAISLVWSTGRGHDAATRAAMAVSCSVPNQGNMGLPIVALAFGAEGVQVGTLLFSIGVVM